jgi:thermostable 8-oxoguanine DNA glycosylase
MYLDSTSNHTVLSANDIEKLKKIAKYLINRITPPQWGLYAEMSENDLFINLILQYCKVGGADMLESLKAETEKFNAFKDQLDLKRLASMKKDARPFVAMVLKEFKATKFYNKQAERIVSLLMNSWVVDRNHLILLNDIDPDTMGSQDIRNKLIALKTHLTMKSASEYMIETGLSIDVIALSTQTAKILNGHFGLHVDPYKLQENRYIYESVEDGLRQGCNQIGIPLAYLDRMLFYFSEKDAISFILEDL